MSGEASARLDPPARPDRRDRVVIGGSAGAIRTLSTLLGQLPQQLPAAIIVVLHRSEESSAGLQAVLERSSALPVITATHGLSPRLGHVYLAPPGAHLLINDRQLVLAPTARVNRVRPAVDPLFRSAARWYGPRAIGIVLTGSLDDGAAGLAAVHARDGVCLVQDPGEALFPGMPTAALAAVPAAKALSVASIAAALEELAGQPIGRAVEEPDAPLVIETDLAEHGRRRPGSTLPGVAAESVRAGIVGSAGVAE